MKDDRNNIADKLGAMVADFHCAKAKFLDNLARNLDDVVGANLLDNSYRFCADIDGHGDSLYARYALILGIDGANSHDWGAVLAAYPGMSINAIVNDYCKTTGTPKDAIKVIGTGSIKLDWTLDDPFLKITVRADGPDNHMPVIKACLDSFLADYHPWVLDKVRYDLPG